MKQDAIRRMLISSFQRLLTAGSALLSEEEIHASALILSPHYDDETLGCGGVIHLKRAKGANVHVVFMTDGTSSHAGLMRPYDLERLRRDEGIEACSRLGVAPQSITHLGLPDGRLGSRRSEAIRRVREILADVRPSQVFCPYRYDGTPDHIETYHVAVAAMRDSRIHATLFEFPIWAWNIWPYCRVPLEGRRYIPREAASAVCKNILLIQRINRIARLGSAAAVKRSALSCHRSQMERLMDNKRWPTLADVSHGDFLHCCCSDEEWFVRSPILI